MATTQAPKRGNADHVVMHDGSQGFWGFECTRCKQRQKMPQPVLVDVLIAAGKAFHKLHKSCKPFQKT